LAKSDEKGTSSQQEEEEEEVAFGLFQISALAGRIFKILSSFERPCRK
jgi:hypothetical protein